jgi:hypothetical protein
MTLTNLEKLHESVRADVEAYCGKLIVALGPSIKAISVYGSATGPDFIPKKSNVNLVVVVENLATESLACILGIVAKGRKRNIVPPLIVTPDYIKQAGDVFPIEFFEISASEVLLYGSDYFAGIDVGRESLRLECESQLRAAALRTRQAYLELGTKRKGAERVLHASVTSLIPVLRAMLRLKGVDAPRVKLDVVATVEKTFAVDTATFAAILRDRSGDESIGGQDAHGVLAKYIDDLESLARLLDRM